MFGLVVTIFLLIKAVPLKSEVYWDIQTMHVVFGEDVDLFCHINVTEPCISCTYRWYGGESNQLLTFNGYSINDSKYSTKLEKDGFSLTIKNFNEDDVGIKYSCSFGSYADTKNLSLQGSYEWHPTRDSTFVTYIVDDQSILNVQGKFDKVFPEPICSIYYNGYNITDKFSVNITQNGLFYNMTWELHYLINKNVCSAVLIMTCNIGGKEYILIENNIVKDCSDNDENGFQPLKIFGITGLVIAVLIIISLATTLFCKQKSHKRQFESSTGRNLVLMDTEPSNSKLLIVT